MSSDTAIDLGSICQLQEDIYEVPSEHTPGVKYTVNMAIARVLLVILEDPASIKL